MQYRGSMQLSRGCSWHVDSCTEIDFGSSAFAFRSPASPALTPKQALVQQPRLIVLVSLAQNVASFGSLPRCRVRRCFHCTARC